MTLKTLSFLLLLFLGSQCSKLNVPRVLLPLFYDFQTNFTLAVTDAGCYNWTPLRPNIVRVQCVDPEPELGCCSRVVVAAASKEFRRNTETVLAEDVHSGLVFRCEVILDVIHSLNIVTTTREIFLDESPEAFEVRANDEQGNEFSTLEGVELDWSFRTVGGNNKSGESTVVRYMTFAESPYEAPKSIEATERLGLKGHIILLEGKQTGGAAVTVRLPQPEYAHVPTAGVQLLVLTNLLILPQDATVLKGDSLKYRLQRFQQGKVTEIKFPSTQYHLASEDKSVEVDGSSGIASGLSLGKARIFLVDVNAVESDVKPPSATLSVSVPHELTLAVLPSRKWTVVIGQEYDIITELYDVDRKRFQIGENAVLGIRLDESYFKVDIRPRNGSFVHGVPLKVGRTKVIAELLGVRDPLGGILQVKSLSTAADLHIYDPIRITPSKVYIPWDPIAKARYEIPFSASGGDGTYTWSSTRSAVAAVTQRGIATTLEEGSTTIAAAMTLNPTIRGTSIIQVMPAVALEILDTPLEAEIGRPISVHVVLFGEVNGLRVPFTLCDSVPFEITLTDSNFQQIKGNVTVRPEPSCATIFLTGLTTGAAQVTVKYGRFSASAVVAAYRPLRPLNPSSGTTLLTVGTSRLIVFTGGPRSWAMKPSEHFHTLRNSDRDEEQIHVSEQAIPLAAPKDAYAFLVSCRQLSETTLTLEIVNKVVGSKSEPSVASSSVDVICGKPKYLILSPVAINKTKCPLNAEDVVALSYKDLELEVTVKDAQGRRFDNITSLDFLWSISSATLAKIEEPMRVVAVEEEGFVFPGLFIQAFKTRGRSGIVEVEGKVVGYNGEVLFSQNLLPESPPFPEITANGVYQTPEIRASLSVTLVNATIVSPEKTEIFGGDGEERLINVRHGSGHYEITPSISGVIDVAKKGRLLRVKALQVGSVVLQVKDVCLETDPVEVHIQVYRIGSITLDVLEYIEKGKSIEAFVSIYDEIGNPLTTLPSPDVLKLTPMTDSKILSVNFDSSSAKTSRLVFSVRGLELGETTLAISAGKDVVSRSVPIHVFQPLRLSPRNVTVFVGSSLQVSTSDGPPGSHLQFSIDDEHKAKVSVDGTVEGLTIGVCSLTARAVVIHRETGQKIVASEDRVDIRVVPLKGVTIHTPITTIVAGGKMPLWAVGPPGTLSVLRLGLSNPATRFTWSVSQESCAEIRTVFHDLGLLVPDNEKVVMRFVAVKPGRVVVTLKVRVPGSVAGSSQPVEYSDTATIDILPVASLINPRPMVLDYLLLTPQAVTELRLSRGMRHQFKVLSGNDVVQITQDGILSSTDDTGTAIIMVGPPEKPWRHIVVYVRLVEYIMVNVVPHWQLLASDRLNAIPNGLDVDLSVSFHDEEGNQFDAVRSNILAKTDQKGLVNVGRGTDNGTLVLNMLESGISLVQVWDSRSQKQPADYLPVASSDLSFPPNVKISVGDVICLRMPVISAEDTAAAWTSSDPAKLRIWSEVGLAMACGKSGVATLAHEASPRLRSRITVSPISKIDLLPHDIMLTTAPEAVAEYPLVLSAAGEKDKQRNLVAYNDTCGKSVPTDFSPSYFPFVCKLHFNNPITSAEIAALFHVAPTFSINTGVHSCRVESIGKPSVASATLTEAIVLQVVTLDGSVMSQASLVPFTPGLFLHQSQIKVTYSKPSDEFTLSGIKDVFNQIKIVSDKHLVTVSLSSQTDTSRTFKVSVDQAWWTLEDPPALSIILWSKLTAQKFQIGIRCGGLRASEDSWSWTQWSMLLAIGLLSSLAIYVWATREPISSSRTTVVTSQPPYLPNLEETLLARAHVRPSSFSSSESSPPLGRPFDNYPVYGSPWRHETTRRRRE